MNAEERKILAHIVRHGDDRQLQASHRDAILRLRRMGFIRRRIGDWAWVPTATGRLEIPGAV
jgi:hypothetical protein